MTERLILPTEREGITVDRSRKTYRTPELIQFGRVAQLTEGGSPYTSSDGVTGMMNNPSDRRLKEDICEVGRHPCGFGVYLFYYKSEYRGIYGYGRQFGVMADEVEQIIPEAVSVHRNGYKTVDYEMLGISRNLH